MGIDSLSSLIGAVATYTIVSVISVLFIVLFYFLYRFVSMANQPLDAMKAIYLYLVSFIGLVFILMGAYPLLTLLFDTIFGVEGFSSAMEVFSKSATDLIIGGVVFYIHWFRLLKKGK